MAALVDAVPENLFSRRVFVRALTVGSLLALVEELIAGAQLSSPDLYAQATRAKLDREFPFPDVEYVLLDARTRGTIALRWLHPDLAIPVGSLLKPFVAMAYSRMEPAGKKFPTVDCHGRSDGCWRAGGHGSMTIEPAVAESCNAYFLALARELAAGDGSAMQGIAGDFGLPGPPPSPTAAMLIGLTPEWRIAPAPLAYAYAGFAVPGGERPDSAMGQVVAGLRAAALPGGTAAKLGPHPGGAMAKTGTAPCVPDANGQRCLVNGDGLAMALAPAENPRWALLVRQRGTTGAHAAEVAGKMLTGLEGADEIRSQARQ